MRVIVLYFLLFATTVVKIKLHNFIFLLRVPEVYITEKYASPSEFLDDALNFQGFFEINYGYQGDGEKKTGRDLVAIPEHCNYHYTTSINCVFRRFSLPR